MYRKILVAYNGTPESRPALHECIRLAPGPSAEIHLLAVVHLSSYLMGEEYVPEDAIAIEEQKMKQELAEGHALMAGAGLHVIEHLEVGEPAHVIGKLADELGIELVIVGHSRHQSWAMRWWRGSTDALLVEKVRCSLLVAAEGA
jgi:nucleotide-binding universal stress UspA family protein